MSHDLLLKGYHAKNIREGEPLISLMPANIPSTSNGGGCFTRNSPSRCMVDLTTSHKKFVNSPNGYLLQPFKKLTPIASQSSVSPSTKITAPKEKIIEETQPYSDSSRPTTAAIKTSCANAGGKSVKISDSPPNIIGYDGGFDYYYCHNPSQGDGQEDALSLSPFSNGHLSGNCSKPERTEISSDDEEEIDYDDMNDNWEGGRNRSREERRKWALQTALNTERNAITKNLTTSPPPLSSVVRSQDNGPAFRVRTWGESSSSSVGCTALTKSNGNTHDNSPCGLSGKFKGPSSMSSSPLLTACKPISLAKISDFSPSIKSKDITHSDNDTFMSDVLGHISDFLMAENVKNELGEKSLLEEIAESFKCVTLCNSDPTPMAQIPDPGERPFEKNEPLTSESSPIQPVDCCREECRSTNLKSMENKSFLFSHAGGGLLGKLCTVATSIRESITSHPTLSTTIAPQSNSSTSLVNIKNEVVKEGGHASPQPHLYDLISSTDRSELIPNTSSAPQTQPETVVLERESRKSSSVSVELPPAPKLDPSEGSRHNESPQNVSNPSHSIISPVYEELDYGPPRSTATAPQQRPANYNNTDSVMSEPGATEGPVCNDITAPSTNLTSSLGSTNELVQGKGGKRNAVANFFQKSSTAVGASHKPSFLGLGSGSRKGTREIRKEDIVVVLTSPLTDNSETHPNIPQTTTVTVKLSSPPITCNNGNSIIRFDSKLAAIAKDINDYKGETEGDFVSDLNKPEEALVTGFSNRLTHTLTEHSSLPTLSSNGVGRFDKSVFDSTKSNSLDTNRTQTKNEPALPVSLSKTTICPKIFPPPKQLAGPASQGGGIKSFLQLNSSKKRNGGTLRSKSLDKSTAGTMPSNLSALVTNADRRTAHKGAPGILMVDKKPLCTSSFVDLNSLVTNESSAPISTINTIGHNDNTNNNNSLDKNWQLLTPLASNNNSSGKFASLKNFFRKAPAPATINGHRDSHQRSSLACLTEQQGIKQQSNSPSSAGCGRSGPQRSQIVSSSYDDSGVSLTRTALEDDYATRKNPSYSSALDSFSSEESWSVSSNSAPDDRSNLQQISSTIVLNEVAIGHVKSRVRPDLQSKPLPPIPVNRDLGSSLTFPTILNATNTSSSSELEFSGEGIITARAQLMKSNSSPLQKPLGKPRVPPPKPPVTQNLDRAIPRLAKSITNSKEDKHPPPLDLIIEPPNQIAKSPKCPQTLKKPEVPARPPKLSPKTAQPLSKCRTASKTNLGAKPLTPSAKSDVSDMPRRKPPPPPPIIMMRQENKIDPNEYYDPLANSTTSSLTQVGTQPSNTHTGTVNEKPNDLDAACKSSNGPSPFYEQYLTPVCSSVTVSANVELKEVPTSHITNTAPDILCKKTSQRFSENSSMNGKSGKKGTLKTPCKMDEDERSLIIAGLRPSEIKKNQQKH